SIVHRGGELAFIARAAGREEILAAIPYSTIDHRLWRISERGGMIELATARTAAAPFDVAASTERLAGFDQVVVSLGVSEESDAVIGGRARFDNLSGGGQAAGCPVSRFVDDFEDGRLDRMWGQTSLAGCLLAERSGALAIAGDGNAVCEL